MLNVSEFSLMLTIYSFEINGWGWKLVWGITLPLNLCRLLPPNFIALTSLAHKLKLPGRQTCTHIQQHGLNIFVMLLQLQNYENAQKAYCINGVCHRLAMFLLAKYLISPFFRAIEEEQTYKRLSFTWEEFYFMSIFIERGLSIFTFF